MAQDVLNKPCTGAASVISNKIVLEEYSSRNKRTMNSQEMQDIPILRELKVQIIFYFLIYDIQRLP